MDRWPHQPDNHDPNSITMVMSLVAQVAIASGHTDIKSVEGLWEYRFGDDWALHVNGHSEGIAYGATIIPPYDCLITFADEPLMITGPYEGMVMGMGNEIAIIDALTKELSRLNRSRDNLAETLDPADVQRLLTP